MSARWPLLIACLTAVAHAYSVSSALELQADEGSGLVDGVTCGRIGLPACTSYNVTTGVTTHSCLSDGHPTVGAVLHETHGIYVCEMCGVPNRHACECTHDNNASEALDPFTRPCGMELSHWCFFEPQVRVRGATGQRSCCRLFIAAFSRTHRAHHAHTNFLSVPLSL